MPFSTRIFKESKVWNKSAKYSVQESDLGKIKKSNIDKYLTETLTENMNKMITSPGWRVQETDLCKTVMSLCVLCYLTAAQYSVPLSMRCPCVMVCVHTVHNKLSHILPHRLRHAVVGGSTRGVSFFKTFTVLFLQSSAFISTWPYYENQVYVLYK